MRKFQLLIAISDTDYTEHLRRVLMKKNAETFELTLCSSEQQLREKLQRNRFDVALLEPEIAQTVSEPVARLSYVLYDGTQERTGAADGIKAMEKYQRISSIVSIILEDLAAIIKPINDGGAVTVVWSPAGGCGKTTVALALAAQHAAEGRKVTYLDLESFASTMVYFAYSGKSISTVFERLDSNVELLLQSIRQQDKESGLYYYAHPDNYDDINELTTQDVLRLVDGCAAGMEEVVIDLSSECSEKTKQLLERADTVYLVQDSSCISLAKLAQFQMQNSIYREIEHKCVLVSNRGAQVKKARPGERVIHLPNIRENDPTHVFRALTTGYFDRYDAAHGR